MDKSNFNSQTQKFVLKPSQLLIDNWSLWIAKEVVNRLKTRTTVQFDFDRILTILDLIDLEDFDDVWKAFDNSFNKLKQNYHPKKNFDFVKQKLEREFSKTVSDKLQKLLTSLENKYGNQLQQYMTDCFQKASPENVISSLKDTSKILFLHRRKLENNKLITTEKISSVKQAYKNLINSEDIYAEKNNIWNAFFILFKYKFEKAKNDILSNLLLRILQIVQSFYDSAQKSYLLLSNIEKSLSQKCSVKLISIPVFMYLDAIDINYQQLLIDVWIGHNINYWGISSVTVEEFEQRILQNISNIAQSLFYEFQLSFLENTIIENQ